MPRSEEPSLEEVATARRSECMCWVHRTVEPRHVDQLLEYFGDVSPATHWRHRSVTFPDAIAWLHRLGYRDATQSRLSYFVRLHRTVDR